jgi:hypothetical protein
MQTIGKYVNARHVLVLYWRDPPEEKKANCTISYAHAGPSHPHDTTPIGDSKDLVSNSGGRFQDIHHQNLISVGWYTFGNLPWRVLQDERTN